jgi:hypothetical protein
MHWVRCTGEARSADASIGRYDPHDRPDAARRVHARDARRVLTGLGSARPDPSVDVATALERARSAFGQRPAITVHQLGAGTDAAELRHEQGFGSLAGWVAKGAHLLRDELLLGPGDELGIAGPASWPLAAVALSAWWVGVMLVPSDRASMVVQHVDAGAAPAGATVLWWGDAMDGTDGSRATTVRGGEWWSEAVVPFPDRPPTPVRDGDLTAWRAQGNASTQRDLLARFADAQGVLGIARGAVRPGDPDGDMLAALALRPLATGRATVVTVDLQGTRAAQGPAQAPAQDPRVARIAEAERISGWWAPRDAEDRGRAHD